MNTNPIDLTDLATALITIFMALITRYLIPMIKSKMDESQYSRMVSITQTAVKAAEQLYKNGTIPKSERKEYVRSILQGYGFDVDYNKLESIIECSVSWLPKTHTEDETDLE